MGPLITHEWRCVVCDRWCPDEESVTKCVWCHYPRPDVGAYRKRVTAPAGLRAKQEAIKKGLQNMRAAKHKAKKGIWGLFWLNVLMVMALFTFVGIMSFLAAGFASDQPLMSLGCVLILLCVAVYLVADHMEKRR